MLVYQRVYLHFPMVFLWFSHGFPMVLWTSRLFITCHHLENPEDPPERRLRRLLRPGNRDVPEYIWHWLVVWTPLKNISQLGWLFPIYGKIENGNQTTNQVYNGRSLWKWTHDQQPTASCQQVTPSVRWIVDPGFQRNPPGPCMMCQTYSRLCGLNNATNHPFGDIFFNLFMVIWGMGLLLLEPH